MANNHVPHLPEGFTLLRCTSHRSRQQLQRLSADQLQGFYSWGTACTGGFIACPDQLVTAACQIKGIGKASSRFTYHPCINWS
jgi:hypothetical protein